MCEFLVMLHMDINLNLLCAAGLASRRSADPYSLRVAADARCDHPQRRPDACSRLAPGRRRRVGGPAGIRLEVGEVAVSLRDAKTILVCSHACGLILLRGCYGNQFEGLSQDSGVSRQGASQSHNTGATRPRTQQGKRSKGRHGDKRTRYLGDIDIFVT